MGAYVAAQLVKAMTKKRIQVDGAKVLIMGLAFKENCPDLRNTRIVDVISELKEYNCHVDVFDPWVNSEEAQREYDISPINSIPSYPNIGSVGGGDYDAIVLAVAHRQFTAMGASALRALGKPGAVLYDLKYLLSAAESDLRL
jgi:UDP-N-acetyl-D-galactosamine dehydrogenase